MVLIGTLSLFAGLYSMSGYVRDYSKRTRLVDSVAARIKADPGNI